MVTKYDLINEYKRFGYHKIKQMDIVGCEMMWKKDEEQKAVLILDNLASIANAKSNCRTLRDKAVSMMKGLKRENVLLVIISYAGRRRPPYLGKNVICLAAHSFKVHYGLFSPSMFEEIKIAREVSYTRDAVTRYRNSFFGIPSKYYTASVVYIIMALNIIFSLQAFGRSDLFGFSVDTVYKNKESYRLLSYMFVHLNILHLVGNMLSLFFIGRMYAVRNGAGKFIAVYLYGGVYAAIMSMAYAMYLTGHVDVITVGASGSIFAILGALVGDVLTDKNTHRKFGVVIFCIIGFISSMGANTDIACHFGGMVLGFILAIIFRAAEKYKEDAYYGKYLRILRKKDQYIGVMRNL